MKALVLDIGVSLRALLTSRKFMLLILDSAISLVLYFGAKGDLETIKFIIGVLQPIFVALIFAIAHEDAAAAQSENKAYYAALMDFYRTEFKRQAIEDESDLLAIKEPE